MSETLAMQQSPVRNIRKRGNYTLEDFAKILNLSYTYLCSLETGSADTLSDDLIEKLQKFTIKTKSELLTDYFHFQKLMRKFNCLHFNKDLTRMETWRSVSPLTCLSSYWKLPSTSALSRTLCIPLGLLYMLTKGKLRTLPETVREALLDVGVSEEAIDNLNEGVSEYFDYVNFDKPKRTSKVK